MKKYLIVIMFLLFLKQLSAQNTNAIVIEKSALDTVKYEVIDLSVPLKSGHTIIALSKTEKGESITSYYLISSVDEFKKELGIKDSMIKSYTTITSVSYIKTQVSKMKGDFPNVKNLIYMSIE